MLQSDVTRDPFCSAHSQQKISPSIKVNGNVITSSAESFHSGQEAKQPLLVIKVGTSTMMQTKSLHFCMSNLGKFVDEVCAMREAGYQVVLVCSGAVGAGCIHLKLPQRPETLEGKQAASAVGQCRMMRLYEDLFAIREQKVAQLIITRPDLMDRTRFLNFKNTLKELLRLDVLPIVNENDSIATSHLRFGDNDTLSAYVAVTLGAQWLFLLTDVDCLYTQNPRFHPNAKPIPYVGHLDDVYAMLDESENSGTAWGTGGMRTKIIAAKIATAAGIHTALCHGEHPDRVLDIIRFAEAHAQTQEMWAQILKSLATEDATLVKTGDMPIKPPSSPTSTASTLAPPVDIPRVASNVEASGLAHHHAGPHKRTPSSPSLVSLENNETSPSAPEQQQENLAPEELEETSWGIVTATSLKAMPYLGTIFGAQECTQDIHDQRRWILSLPVRGRIYVDDTTARAVVEDQAPLYAEGIVALEGTFLDGEAVTICRDQCVFRRRCPATVLSEKAATPTPPATGPRQSAHMRERHIQDRRSMDDTPSLSDETELARCLTNFASAELEKIKGLKPAMFSKVLGYVCEDIVAHRDNIIFMNPCSIYGCRHCGMNH